ncbi:MAG: hypothetical protein AVDCRST_MAG68-1076 [uncultured Gemmatimonadetes bacterium]|uniref:Efflux ABC transporter, permease protein n=1 Tax=uncultured Gemmatimonadota bacterium TaxID=203437 RepID=A0A6J4KIF0_9BACT|nr:MAG: hypothetical protein AVDCRST_MAG68-1076 [uncultured Gemmatimonadota bacterium]
MRRVQLLGTFFRLGFLGEAEYRANFALHAFESAVSLATGLTVLSVVFSKTPSIGGWEWNHLMVVLGLWFLVSGVVNMVVAPSIRQFIHDVWLGNLDFLLVKPVGHQFMVSTRKIMVFNVVELFIGTALIATALVRLGARVGPQEVLQFVLSISFGAAVLYSFWVVLGTLALYSGKLENLMLVFYSMFEAGRWPVGLYPLWLRYSLVFVVPIALAITVPAEALVGRLPWETVGLAGAYALVSLAFSTWFFRWSLRHKYMGASA